MIYFANFFSQKTKQSSKAQMQPLLLFRLLARVLVVESTQVKKDQNAVAL